MPMSTEARISSLLFQHVENLSLDPALPVAYPGVPFVPPASGSYLEVMLLWNANVNRGLAPGSSTQFRGILQITVCAPVGEGVVSATSVAGEIASHFERGTQISEDTLKLKIDGRPSIASPISDQDRLRIPVSVNWHAFA